MKRLSWLPLVAALALAGCDDDDDPVVQQLYAHTRVLNASPAAAHANAQMFADEERIGTVFQYGIPSACNTLTVPEGERTISFRTANGVAIAEAQHEFVSGVDYVIALAPDPATAGAARVLVFEEPYPASVATGMNAVRIINGTSSPGDAVLTTPTGSVTTTSPRVTLAPGGSTEGSVFPEFPSANTRLRLYPPGTTTGAFGDFTLGTVGDARTTTVVFTTPTVIRPATGVQLNRCTH